MAGPWYTTGGGEGGGDGEWGRGRSPPCRLVATERGLLDGMELLRAEFEMHYRVGLFQSDSIPRISLILSQLTPCDFSGYSGLQTTVRWTVPVMFGDRARSFADPLDWTHSGGAVANFVFGYYVLDRLGRLAWAERFCPAPIGISRVGETIRVTPTFYLLNEFPD